MRKIPYTDIEIYSNSRIPIIRKILGSIISKLDAQETIVTIYPDNNLIAFCKLTTVISFNLKECINDCKIVIDPRTFNEEYTELYKIKEDEYISFNESSAGLYFNLEEANNKYFYNISQYNLIDKIEDITSYEDFNNNYLNIKADDGCKFFKGYNNKFVIPIFTKFPNISKNDIASLYVYKFDNESNLVVWKVYKKKLSRDVYTIFRTMSF